MKANIGCGYLNREKGEVGIDNNIACRPDICADIQDLPFKDESFDSISATHVLEHIQKIVQVMNEIWRVLKFGGKFIIRVPLFPTIGSVSDPTHVRFFIPATFDYFIQPGKLTGLNYTFSMNMIRINDLTESTQEIECIMEKKKYYSFIQ